MENTDLKTKSERIRAILLLVATAILWSLGGLWIKSVNLNPIAIAGIRSAISAVLLLIVLKTPRITLTKVKIGTALAYVGTVILFVSANKMTTAANAILLQYTAPVYVALLSNFLLNERISKFDWIIISIVLGGMALFFIDNLSTRGMLGNLFAVLSGVSFAVFTVLMRMQKNGKPLESVFLGNILTAIIGIPFMFRSAPTSSDWRYLILLGVVQLGTPYILYSIAIKNVTALEAILIPVIEPILNPVWVFLLMGETPSPFACLGGIIVITAVTFRCIMPIIWNKKNEEIVKRGYMSE